MQAMTLPLSRTRALNDLAMLSGDEENDDVVVSIVMMQHSRCCCCVVHLCARALKYLCGGEFAHTLLMMMRCSSSFGQIHAGLVPQVNQSDCCHRLYVNVVIAE